MQGALFNLLNEYFMKYIMEKAVTTAGCSMHNQLYFVTEREHYDSHSAQTFLVFSIFLKLNTSQSGPNCFTGTGLWALFRELLGMH